jgi:hypothetical protein
MEELGSVTYLDNAEEYHKSEGKQRIGPPSVKNRIEVEMSSVG